MGLQEIVPINGTTRKRLLKYIDQVPICCMLSADAQALASYKDPAGKQQILVDAKAICDAVKDICSSTGMEDREVTTYF